MSLWRNKEEMHQFARSGSHLEAVKKTASMANEVRTLVMEADEFPKWSEAKSLLTQKGKLLRYDK